MSTNATFSTALVGQTETAFGAILDRQLTGTGLSAPQWITLSVALAGGGSVERARLVRQVAGARRVNESDVQAFIDELATEGLLRAPGDERVMVTDAGRRLHGRISTAVAEITQRLWGDLAAEELATAARVLSTVLARANQELSDA
jgi:DNA-binding MarR family transcriptional regulator